MISSDKDLWTFVWSYPTTAKGIWEIKNGILSDCADIHKVIPRSILVRLNANMDGSWAVSFAEVDHPEDLEFPPTTTHKTFFVQLLVQKGLAQRQDSLVPAPTITPTGGEGDPYALPIPVKEYSDLFPLPELRNLRKRTLWHVVWQPPEHHLANLIELGLFLVRD